MVTLDDTQRNLPITDEDLAEAAYEDDSSGPGCLLWGIVGFFTLLLGIGMVMGAGWLGWSNGVPIAQAHATADHVAEVNKQCGHLETDIANGASSGLIQQRIDFLLQETPAPDCLELFSATATAYFEASQPTATATATLVATASPTTLSPSPMAETTELPGATQSDTTVGGYNLDKLFKEAKASIDVSQYQEAIDTLDAIISLDPTWNKTLVEGELFKALMAEATRHYRVTGNIAEGILLTDRAEAFGDVGELNYERSVAQAYLDAQRYIGIDYGLAIQSLQKVLTLSPYYQNGDVSSKLYQQYVGYADVLVATNQHCFAVSQFDSALAMQYSAGVQGRRDAAQQICENGVTPAAPGADGSTPEGGYQPIGQP